jgi:DHA3 family tetracycline resistance protein-like MFS transporter
MALFEKYELKFLWPFYLESLISKLFYILPGFMAIYFFGLGLNMFQISLLFAVWSLFSLIFDIPTGAIADIYGRKFSVLLGTFLMASGFLAIYFFTNYFIILGIMAFIGLSSTFVSGADDAWATDLINKKNKNLLHGYFAKTMSLSSIGFVISGLIGAFFVKSLGIGIIWIATSLSLFVSFFILIFAREYYIKKEITFGKSLKNIKNQTKTSIKYSYRNKALFYLILAGFFLVFASSFSNLVTWTGLLKNLSFPDYAFGYFMSAIAFIGIFAPLISIKLMKSNKERNFILFSSIGLIIFIFGIIFSYNLTLVFTIVLGFSFFQYMIMPAKSTYFQKFIPTKLRATIGSIDSMLVSLVGIIALPIAGFLADSIGSKYTIFISGFIVIPAIFILILLKKYDKN